jgi:hypothetical protein
MQTNLIAFPTQMYEGTHYMEKGGGAMQTAMTERISQSLSEEVNERIRERTLEHIEYYRGHVDEIENRLQELAGEWPLERILQTNAAGLALTGVALGAFVNRRWLILSAVPCAFLILHGLTGWAPPVEGLRRMGVRSVLEIDQERCALMRLQGK